VASVEVKQLDLPEEMLRAMAKQAEAEREKRAKIIHAEGEFSAAQRLVEAGDLLASQPITIQLRYLQTLTEIGVEKNTTIVFPLPVDIMAGLQKLFDGFGSGNGTGTTKPAQSQPSRAVGSGGINA
jgi:regulator of protease activity HflC (stomatin/prohibitin superfamily)